MLIVQKPQPFGKAEAESDGVAMGMVGLAGSGRLRVQAKDTQKLGKGRLHLIADRLVLQFT